MYILLFNKEQVFTHRNVKKLKKLAVKLKARGEVKLYQKVYNG